MSQITPNLRTMLVLGVALVVAGAVLFQQREMLRLRAAIAELTSLRGEQAVITGVTNALPPNIEELHREAAEVQGLRAELAQLRRETSELQASIEKLAQEVSAIRGNFNGRSGSPMLSQATSLARSSPEEAARWVAALPAGDEQNQAAMVVIDRWIHSDPLAAATWTTQFADGPLREEVMSVVARQWGMRDWNATAGWMETLPMGSSRDAAIGAFVMSADGYDIKLALEWANRMGDPERRADRVERTARRWLREDNSAARAWIEKAQLPTGLAERLLSGK